MLSGWQKPSLHLQPYIHGIILEIAANQRMVALFEQLNLLTIFTNFH